MRSTGESRGTEDEIEDYPSETGDDDYIEEAWSAEVSNIQSFNWVCFYKCYVQLIDACTS
jgi:hypothetical protein